MRLPSVKFFAILMTVIVVDARPIFSGEPVDFPSTATAIQIPVVPAIEAQALDPLKVVVVRVGMERLTTIRFPSPISDLISGRASTEPHPEALFSVLFHPGEAFFSLQALRTNAVTSLNVVWASQTFVFELQASPTPVLSLVLTNPQPKAIQRATQVTNRVETVPTPNIWERFEAAAIHDPTLRRLFPRGTQVFTRFKLDASEETPLKSVRLEDIIAFPQDRIAVVQMTVSNHTAARMDAPSYRLQMTRAGKPVRFLHIHRIGDLHPFGTATLFGTIGLDSKIDPEAYVRSLQIHFDPQETKPSTQKGRRP